MAGLVHGSIDMDAMERKFLTSNINKQDNDDTRLNDSGDEMEKGDPERGSDYNPTVEAIAAAAPQIDKSMLTMNRAEGGNTGPKGVKADYNEWKLYHENERKKVEEERDNLILRLVTGTSTTSPSISYSAMEAQRALDKKSERNKVDQEDQLLDDLEDDEDSFMEAYRKKRIEEYQKKMRLPTYNKVTSVDGFQFIDRLESTDSNVCVVVHMYEENISACRKLNTSLESLAKEHPHTDFIKLKKSDTPTGIPCHSLPFLLIYKNGKLIDTIASIVDQIGSKCDKDDVEELLMDKGVFGVL
jgi:hypothetical protein